MRAFVALRLDADAEAAIDAVAREVAKRANAKPTLKDDLHVTLKFLGDVDRDSVARPVFEAAARAIARVPKALTFDALTGFPHARRATVAVLEATHVPDPLVALAREVDDAAAALGVPAETRPYRPHVTLARLKPPRALPDYVYNAPIVAHVRALALCETRPPGSLPHYVDVLSVARAT